VRQRAGGGELGWGGVSVGRERHSVPPTVLHYCPLSHTSRGATRSMRVRIRCATDMFNVCARCVAITLSCCVCHMSCVVRVCACV